MAANANGSNTMERPAAGGFAPEWIAAPNCRDGASWHRLDRIQAGALVGLARRPLALDRPERL